MSDDVVNLYLSDAALTVDSAIYKTWYTIALDTLAAHYVSRVLSGAANTNSNALSKTVGDLTVSQGSPLNMATGLKTTGYGNDFLAIVRRVSAGVTTA